LLESVPNPEDKDHTTADSYFFETFENLSAQDDPGALGALKCMLLCKVMLIVDNWKRHNSNLPSL